MKVSITVAVVFADNDAAWRIQIIQEGNIKYFGEKSFIHLINVFNNEINSTRRVILIKI